MEYRTGEATGPPRSPRSIGIAGTTTRGRDSCMESVAGKERVNDYLKCSLIEIRKTVAPTLHQQIMKTLTGLASWQ